MLTPEQIAEEAAKEIWQLELEIQRGQRFIIRAEDHKAIILSAITQALEQEKKGNLGLKEASTATTHARQKWSPIETLDRDKMHFVLVTDGSAIRLYLWNPVHTANAALEHTGALSQEIPVPSGGSEYASRVSLLNRWLSYHGNQAFKACRKKQGALHRPGECIVCDTLNFISAPSSVSGAREGVTDKKAS